MWTLKAFYKLVQPLWRTVWRFLKKLEIELPMIQQSHCWAYTLRKLWTAARQAPLSMWILQARILEWVAMPSSRGSSTGIEPGSPALEADSSPIEPPGKPKDTGVHSLSLLQRIFPTQELNWHLLHCRQILYQLSYQGSLNYTLSAVNFLNMAGSGQGRSPI